MLYEDARNQFDSSEAEVYKKGDVLVLRLRSLKFSSARSSLEKNSYPLLSKVNNVIKSFGDSKIIIEGHTDSVGGKQLNQKLSLDRANAVRDYFLANFNYQPDAIEAIGFGYEKPLATNKTAQGRSQNRRVDIFVHPVIKMDTASNN
jgi:outer membrane protein OmpA-like peptidoglycan-associated protein